MRMIFLVLIFHSYIFTKQSLLNDRPYVSRLLTMELDSRMTCLYETLEKGMILILDYSPMLGTNPIALRLTSPSGQFSDWAEGDDDVYMNHNVSENGDYEICLTTRRPLKVVLSIHFYEPDAMKKSMDNYFKANQIEDHLETAADTIVERVQSISRSIRTYNKASVRDEAMQLSNSYYIKTYVLIFCFTNILVAVTQVAIIHRMFYVDPKRLRV
ncbi:hypothetical protein NECAME_02789 [Necator americanus]|uniref:GOLD domain-containing protein n=2 Tax=Necator americanus TaxID=51031 RepID=W2TA72_NECAM|nr:hypothetical protein NECAME_02789 [Necator americanus]ETN78925.1 hypothetical protein NECAME_02789 [Necator americanus]